ncbi:MAG: hypothetical protein KC983_05720 [Phycisphaerales bacterium]|nr:hypothetical protein [Phycisphaerales bacterium]
MSGSLVTILIMVAWAIISAIAQSQNKKKNPKTPVPRPPQQRPGQGQAKGTAGQPQAGPIAQGRSRLDELTARRKAQLDQLRQQRGAGGGGSGGRISPTPMEPQPVQSSHPPRKERTIEVVPLGRQAAPVTPERHSIKVVPATREGLHASREQERNTRAAARDSRREVVERPAKPAPKPKRSAARIVAPVDTPAAATPIAATAADAFAIAPMPQPTAAPYSMSRAAPLTSGEAIRVRLKDRQLLRELVVMKEVFDPPIAMREKHLA